MHYSCKKQLQATAIVTVEISKDTHWLNPSGETLNATVRPTLSQTPFRQTIAHPKTGVFQDAPHHAAQFCCSTTEPPFKALSRESLTCFFKHDLCIVEFGPNFIRNLLFTHAQLSVFFSFILRLSRVRSVIKPP